MADEHQQLLPSAGEQKRTKQLTSTRIVVAILSFVLILAGVAIIVLAVYIIRGNSSSSDKDAKCDTPGCTLSAAAIISSMNLSADPCDDFYEFTCGGWIRSHPIPSDSSSISTFSVLNDANLEDLHQVLEGSYFSLNASAQDQANFDKVKTLYLTCMNTDALETLGLASASVEFSNILALPFNTTETRTAALTYVHSLGVFPFFYPSVEQDLKDATENALYISQAGLGLPVVEYYQNATKTLAYQKFISDSFATLNISVSDPSVVEAIVQLEIAIANVSWTSADQADVENTYNKWSLANLTAASDFVNWPEYFAGLGIKNATTVVVETPQNIRALTSIAQNASDEVLHHYLLWHFVLSFYDYFPLSLQKPKANFRLFLSGVQTPPRWKTCVRIVDSTIGYMSGKWFVEKKAAAFLDGGLDEAASMINAIKAAFRSNIPTLDWMDPETQAKAIEKLDAFIDKVGYPDYLFDAEKVAEKYAGFNVSTDYIATGLSYSKFSLQQNLADFGEPVDRSRWEMTPPTVNAYYNPSLNEIAFPAGILQAPFFTAGALPFLNLGAIGVVIGHEVTHGFDNTGRQFDANGDLTDWWTEQSSEAFNSRAQCFIDQYSSYKIQNLSVNGNLTLGENLADNGGLKQAFAVWKQQQNEGNALRLPGLSLSSDQLLFVSFAQVWCSNRRPEDEIQKLYSDPHSPPIYRVIGTVSNSVDFARAFNCPAGSPMNPEKKCEIW